MSYFVKSIDARRLHGRLDVRTDFFPDVNILYGKNGSGKTTILHIVANILSGSYDRFAYLNFSDIRLVMSDDAVIEIHRAAPGTNESSIDVSLNGTVLAHLLVRDILRRTPPPSAGGTASTESPVDVQLRYLREQIPPRRTAYFPAFRTVIEALSRDSDERRRRLAYGPRVGRDLPVPPPSAYSLPPGERIAELTAFARDLFGAFVPPLDYPSPQGIESQLSAELQRASYLVATSGQEILSEAFIQAFAAASRPSAPQSDSSAQILADIRQLLDDLGELQTPQTDDRRPGDAYTRLRGLVPIPGDAPLPEYAAEVLAVYRSSLQQRLAVQRNAFRRFEEYRGAVNRFLEGKSLVYERPTTRTAEYRIRIEYTDGSQTTLRALSSGERQIVTMLYAAMHSGNPDTVVLIDEPELSLHIDWQRPLLRRMSQLLGPAQVIACTHSPTIGADYMERYIQVTASQVSPPDLDLTDDEDDAKISEEGN